MVGPSGFEPPTSTPPAWRATRLRYGPTLSNLLMQEPMLVKAVSPSSPQIGLILVILIQNLIRRVLQSLVREGPGSVAGSHRQRW